MRSLCFAGNSAMDPHINDRFHLPPSQRLGAVAMMGGFVGVLSGFYEGIKVGSLRYLTENSHRLPRTVGGWYFYHKKKNYVMIVGGCKAAIVHGFKFSAAMTGLFGLEAAIDEIRGTIDCFSTTAAATVTAASYAWYHQLSRVQTSTYIKKGLFLGLSLGITQDLIIWRRGGRIWYMDQMGIVNPRVEEGTLAVA